VFKLVGVSRIIMVLLLPVMVAETAAWDGIVRSAGGIPARSSSFAGVDNGDFTQAPCAALLDVLCT